MSEKVFEPKQSNIPEKCSKAEPNKSCVAFKSYTIVSLIFIIEVLMLNNHGIFNFKTILLIIR